MFPVRSIIIVIIIWPVSRRRPGHVRIWLGAAAAAAEESGTVILCVVVIVVV